jgi:hypothetical protein
VDDREAKETAVAMKNCLNLLLVLLLVGCSLPGTKQDGPEITSHSFLPILGDSWQIGVRWTGGVSPFEVEYTLPANMESFDEGPVLITPDEPGHFFAFNNLTVQGNNDQPVTVRVIDANGAPDEITFTAAPR